MYLSRSCKCLLDLLFCFFYNSWCQNLMEWGHLEYKSIMHSSWILSHLYLTSYVDTYRKPTDFKFHILSASLKLNYHYIYLGSLKGFKACALSFILNVRGARPWLSFFCFTQKYFLVWILLLFFIIFIRKFIRRKWLLFFMNISE